MTISYEIEFFKFSGIGAIEIGVLRGGARFRGLIKCDFRAATFDDWRAQAGYYDDPQPIN